MRYNDRPVTNEYRYQAIKLWNSGQISLTELKAMFRIVAIYPEQPFVANFPAQAPVLYAREESKQVGIAPRAW